MIRLLPRDPAKPPRCRPTLETLEERVVLDTCTVNRFGDLGKGRGLFGDLRYCMNETNARPGQDLIIFAGTGTIHLKSALPSISDDLLLFGPGADQVTIRRNTGGNYRVFTVNAGVNAEIRSLTITNGFASSTTWGGGIHNSGTLLLESVAVVGNRADCGSCSNARGGGILNAGTLTLANSLVANNVVHGSGSFGGGIDNRPNASLMISNSTIAANIAEDDGSYDNTVQGGGIFNSSTSIVTILNSTITKNSVVKTGSSGNASGGGIKGNVLLLRNSIVALNTAQSGNDVSGQIQSSVHVLVGGNPLLGPLQHNGGPTMTVALLPGSPAINSGGNFNNPEFDQRGSGFNRVVNDIVDIGSFEVQASEAPGDPPDAAVLVSASAGESRATDLPATTVGASRSLVVSALGIDDGPATEKPEAAATRAGTPAELPFAPDHVDLVLGNVLDADMIFGL
jgi:hypothetical protein